MTEPHSPSFADAPTRSAEGAMVYFSKFGSVNAVFVQRDGDRWVLNVIFDDTIYLDQVLPNTYGDLPVRFGVDRYIALAG